MERQNTLKNQSLRINNFILAAIHLFMDIVSLAISHIIFFTKSSIPNSDILINILPNLNNSYVGAIFLSALICFWVFVFYVAGLYSNVNQKSGIIALGPTLFSTFIGTLIIFYFSVNLNGFNAGENYYHLSLKYFIITFFSVFMSKMILIHRFQTLLTKGKIGYHLLLIGSDENALNIIKQHYSDENKFGDKYIGFISTEQKLISSIKEYIPHLGTLDNLQQIISDLSFDEAIISMHNYNHYSINASIEKLKSKNCTINLSVNPNSFIKGTIKTQKIEDSRYITINNFQLSAWQSLVKIITDKVLASIGLVVALPLLIIISIIIKASTKGPVFYNQTRIGKNKKPFKIHKFRTMRIDAEKNGPSLSSANDSRITPIGKYLRKWHLDEIPQLINVLLGQMSLVGPRPERKFFINQILPKAPQYEQIFTVKPGLTSWGMVKFGYAENLDQMIERMEYDLYYLENRSLATDFKIMLYTLKSIIKGDGK